MDGTLLLTNALLVDCVGDEPRELASVAVEGARISRVFDGPPSGSYGRVVDCSGMTLMPGLTDAHVHIGAVDVNILDQHRERPSNLTALLMARILEDTLMQGFTTVRDAGGADWSFKSAVEQGVVEGPRLLVSDKPLSQTGGHGDYGVPEDVIRKIDQARKLGIEALRLAYQADVKIASGSDLLGPLQDRKARELEIKTAVMTPMEALVSATRTNAELFGLQDEIGTIEEGKLADLLLVDGNLLEDISVLQKKASLKLIVKGGRVVKDSLAP